MAGTDMRNKNLQWLVLALAIVIAALVVYALTPYGAATTPDSLYYILAAESFSAGQGLLVPDFTLQGGDYQPLTRWPPLYPVLLSLFLFFSSTAEMAAKYFNIILLCITVVVFIQLAKRGVGVVGAGLAAVFLVLQPPILMVFTYAWSEGLFIPLVLLGYLSAIKFVELARSGELKQSRIWLSVSGLFLVLACYTRYLGIAFLLALIVMIFLAFKDAPKQAIKYSLGVGTLCSLLTLPVFLRNYFHSTHMFGMEIVDSENRMLSDIVRIGKILELNLINLNGISLIILGTFVLAVIGFWVYRVKSKGFSWYVLQHWSSGEAIIVPLVWAASFFIILLIARRLQYVDLETRMISVTIPFILFAALAAGRFLAVLIPMSIAFAPLIFWAILQTQYSLDVYHSAIKSWRENYTPDLKSDEKYPYNNFTNNPQYKIYKTFYHDMRKLYKDPVFFYKKPIVLCYLTGAKVKEPPSRFNRANVALMNSLGGSQGILLINDDKGVEALVKAYGDSLEGLNVLPESKAYSTLIIKLPLPVPVE